MASQPRNPRKSQVLRNEPNPISGHPNWNQIHEISPSPNRPNPPPTNDRIQLGKVHILKSNPLSQDELRKMNAWWRAANYLSVGQIYLYDNPLLTEPLTLEHIKPRLLGHFGTTPGLNFIYVHCNRLIRQHDLNMIYVCGPGHGGPGMVANTWLEGSYSEFYPNICQNVEGMKRLFTQFSFPGGRLGQEL